MRGTIKWRASSRGCRRRKNRRLWRKTPPERLERQIQITDGAIDRLVYELYGLTEEEIKIVEG